jgi:lipopolysaccharide export system protein LptA
MIREKILEVTSFDLLFSVSKTGAVTGVEVVQSGGAVFDAEVIRVLKKKGEMETGP